MFGITKWFNTDKGYGFIAPESGGNDVFVHIRDLQKSGLQTLAEGARVSFDVKLGNNGKESASNIALA